MDLSNISSSSSLTCESSDVGDDGNKLNTVLQTSIVKLLPPSAEFSASTFDYDACIKYIGIASTLYSIIWVS